MEESLRIAFFQKTLFDPFGVKPGLGAQFSSTPFLSSPEVGKTPPTDVCFNRRFSQLGIRSKVELLTYGLFLAITVKGYSHNESNPREWYVDFPSGYHLPLRVEMARFSGEEWNELYGVEILADFGEQALDWEFCMDDLEIMFFRRPQVGIGKW